MFHSIRRQAEKLENGKDYGHRNGTDYCKINICIYLKSFLIVKKPLLSNLFISISGAVVGHQLLDKEKELQMVVLENRERERERGNVYELPL